MLGLLTLAVTGLAVLGLRRTRRWVDRWREWPVWRFRLRLLPQVVAPVAAVCVVGVLPLLEHNSASALDAWGLWPAAGILLTVARLVARSPPSAPEVAA